MSEPQIVPAVDTGVLNAIKDVVPVAPVVNVVNAAEDVDLPADVLDLGDDLSFLQRLAAKDKSAIAAWLVNAAVLGVSALNIHLGPKSEALLSGVVSAGLAYFVHRQLNPKK